MSMLPTVLAAQVPTPSIADPHPDAMLLELGAAFDAQWKIIDDVCAANRDPEGRDVEAALNRLHEIERAIGNAKTLTFEGAKVKAHMAFVTWEREPELQDEDHVSAAYLQAMNLVRDIVGAN